MNKEGVGDKSINYSLRETPIGCCICPSCGHELSHHKFAPCNQRRCPECGILMVWDKGGGSETINELTSKKELVALGKSLLNGHKRSIALHVKNAIDAGATRKEILQVVASIMGDARLLSPIIELLKALRYEEDRRRALYISVVDDVWEEI